MNIGPGYPGVKYIATNSDFQSLKLTSPSADGKRIDEDLIPTPVDMTPLESIEESLVCNILTAVHELKPCYTLSMM